ncbi:MAG: HAD family hydrolase [Arthrobacter sp.]
MTDGSDFPRTFGDWQPSAVVFDCDGLLMDTESLWIQTQRLVSESHGVFFDADLQHRLVGLPASRIGPLIASRAGADPNLLIEQLLQMNMAMVAQSAVPMPGARSFVAAVSSRVPLAVASNSARRILDQTLLRGKFGGVFSVTVSAEEVANPKPEPDVYLAAADALDLQPKDCLAFEDSEAGATAARSAGMKVIAIQASPDQQPSADLLLASLEATELLDWVQGWG